MKDISIGSWAYAIGPYEDSPVPWDEVTTKLKELNFQGVELGGFSVRRPVLPRMIATPSRPP